MHFDQAIRAVTGCAQSNARAYPAASEAEAELTATQRQHVAGLMRVNHAGEVAAQALYHGQGIVSKNKQIQAQMQQAALEEGNHLAWCSQRLLELNSHASYLNPVWYVGSFMIGAVAGLVGDQWSLGFVAETEYQVGKHLEEHMKLLPEQDSKSIKILQQMQRDEEQHREDAIHAGAATLPFFIRKLMRWTANVMVKTAYYI